MLLGLGVDLMDVARMEEQSRDSGFLQGVFTPGELAYCMGKRSPAQHLAARFAAKESFFKALGIDPGHGLPWCDVEIRNDPSGRPGVLLHGALGEAARRKGVRAIHISLSHAGGMAIAHLVLES